MIPLLETFLGIAFNNLLVMVPLGIVIALGGWLYEKVERLW